MRSRSGVSGARSTTYLTTGDLATGPAPLPPLFPAKTMIKAILPPQPHRVRGRTIQSMLRIACMDRFS
jgi:hypothetical protein